MITAMSAILFLKLKNPGGWFLLLDLKNPVTLLLVQVAVGLAVYGVIAGLSPMIAFVEFRSQIISYLSHSSGRPEKEAPEVGGPIIRRRDAGGPGI